ncbi:MAG TPA: hypothetical protein DEA22_14525 [Blastocatellia bacterium]|nr:hypothetical protein [Blastocatellia bacterium]
MHFKIKLHCVFLLLIVNIAFKSFQTFIKPNISAMKLHNLEWWDVINRYKIINHGLCLDSDERTPQIGLSPIDY